MSLAFRVYYDLLIVLGLCVMVDDVPAEQVADQAVKAQWVIPGVAPEESL